ncbi:MAG: hypothetical protein Q8R29_00970 [bacterium]|nr:hypothetical protein [bacterium]
MTSSLFAGVIALAVLLEGANFLSGGSLQLAALQRIAQAEQQTTSTTDHTSSGTTSSAPATTDTSTTSSAPTPATATQPATTEPTPTTQTPSQTTPSPTNQAPQPSQPQGQGHEGQGQFSQDIPDREEYFDPREIKQVLREIKDLRSQIKQLGRQAKKLSSAAEETAILSKVSGELDQFQSLISSNSQNNSILREAVQDFRDNQYWEVLNKIRAKVELPQQLKQMGTSLKRVEKVLANKSVQNIGLDIAKAQSVVAEMRQHYDAVQNLYSSGELDEAMQEMQFFHEGGHPGEIEGTIYRIRDIKNMLKKIKDTTIQAEVDGVLQEVVDKFNAGEYRDARETMDEYADDLMRLIQSFTRPSFRGGPSQESMNKIRNLENLIKSKLETEGNRDSNYNPFSAPKK